MGEDREKNSYVYEFDELNRMEKVYRGDGKWAEYEYDGTSARVGKTVGTASSEETETTKYYNMGATVLNEVSSEEGNTTNLIGAGIEARMSVTGSSITSAYFLQKNAHGDVTAAISGTERVATYDYDAFGNTLVEEGEINNPIRYSGEYLDEETGLIYLRARYYDPSVGRFISEDTHWNPTNMIYGDKEYEEGETKIPNIASILQSSNLYAYCSGEPVNRFDCTGNEWASLRELAASLADIYGSDYEFWLNPSSAYLTMGGGYTEINGTFFYDGDVYMQDTGRFESVASNEDGSLYMQRTDFYRAMGVSYETGQISFTVTSAGKFLQSLVVGYAVSYLFDGTLVSGFIAGLIDNMTSRDIGDYWVRTTTVYRYDPMGDWYDTITTYEVYYKSPYYSDYTEEPIEIITYYQRVGSL